MVSIYSIDENSPRVALPITPNTTICAFWQTNAQTVPETEYFVHQISSSSLFPTSSTDSSVTQVSLSLFF